MTSLVSNSHGAKLKEFIVEAPISISNNTS